MTTVLRGLLGGLGLSAIAISLLIVGLGATQTTWGFEHAYGALLAWRGPVSPAWLPSMDSELRFYAPLFGAFGVLCLIAARGGQRLALTPWLALVFFLGGLGRAVSWASVGPPHPLFVALMGVELVLPPILAGLWFGARSRA